MNSNIGSNEEDSVNNEQKNTIYDASSGNTPSSNTNSSNCSPSPSPSPKVSSILMATTPTSKTPLAGSQNSSSSNLEATPSSAVSQISTSNKNSSGNHLSLYSSPLSPRSPHSPHSTVIEFSAASSITEPLLRLQKQQQQQLASSSSMHNHTSNVSGSSKNNKKFQNMHFANDSNNYINHNSGYLYHQHHQWNHLQHSNNSNSSASNLAAMMHPTSASHSTSTSNSNSNPFNIYSSELNNSHTQTAIPQHFEKSTSLLAEPSPTAYSSTRLAYSNSSSLNAGGPGGLYMLDNNKDENEEKYNKYYSKKNRPTSKSFLFRQIIWIIGALITVLIDVFQFWNTRIQNYLIPRAFRSGVEETETNDDILSIINNKKISEKEQLSILKRKIGSAKNFEEWEHMAYRIDSILGNDLWRQNPASKKYDYRLISTRLKHLIQARQDENTHELVTALRSGLLRNLGSLGNSDLYNRAYSGTKLLIEDYISEVLKCLEYLDNLPTTSNQYFLHSNSTSNPNLENSNQLVKRNNTEASPYASFATHQQKLDFFHDTRQSFGRTALVLHGGSLFGMCHLGVVKVLCLQGLLPKIISGTTVGAIIAALICSHSDDELLPILDNVSRILPQYYNQDEDDVNENEDDSVKFYSNVERVLKSSYPSEIILLEKYVSDHLGDLTFEEAYIKSDRALNIMITPSDPSMPKLLNYLTTPHVIIRTAVNASIGTGIIHKEVELLIKNHLGKIVPFNMFMRPPNAKAPINSQALVRPPTNASLSTSFNLNSTGTNKRGDTENSNSHESTTGQDNDGGYNSETDLDNDDDYNSDRYRSKIFYTPSNCTVYTDRESPYTKLSELFNVNNFIVSLARPYLASLFAGEQNYKGYGGILPKLSRVLKYEIQHRLRQLARLGLLPEIVQRFFVDEKIPIVSGGGALEVTIVPELPSSSSIWRNIGKTFDTQNLHSKVEDLILMGERSVWPVLQLIWARCAIEYVLDDMYNVARKGNSRR